MSMHLPLLTKNNPYLIDSHCHLLDEPLISQLPDVIQAAFAFGVQHFIVPSTQSSDFPRLQALLQQYDCITPAFGYHPLFLNNRHLADDLSVLNEHLLHHPQALVGEIGLDFGNKQLTPTDKAQQIAYFEAQLQLASTHQRPVILHYRASLDTMLVVLRQANFTGTGMLHAYSGSIEQARPWLQMGFKLGLGSVLLKPNARKIIQLLPHLQPHEFVLETDAPYMVSSSLHQSYNEPKFVRTIAEELAAHYHCSWQDIAYCSSSNVAQLLATVPTERFSS